MSEIFSKNFTYEELIKSATAKRLGIDNTPSPEEKEKLKRLAVEILQPIRDAWKAPIIITSGYRCKKLNDAVGGAKTSQHSVGEAADIRTVSDSRAENKKLFNMILKMIEKGTIQCGQLIDEYNGDWIHISLPRTNGKPNNQVLHVK